MLVLTARTGLGDRVAGLDSGADDYCVKPVDAQEIAARLRALLRRPGPRGSPVLAVGALRYDVAARSLRHNGVEVTLTHNESELIELLLRRAGTVVRKSYIIDMLHGLDDDVTSNAVEALVSRLRHKLDGAQAESPVRTIRGVGYMLDTSD